MNKNIFDNFLLAASASFISSSFLAENYWTKLSMITKFLTPLKEYRIKYCFLFASTKLDAQENSRSSYANLTYQNCCCWIPDNENLFAGTVYLQRLNLVLLIHNEIKLKKVKSKHEPLVSAVCIFVKLLLVTNSFVTLKNLKFFIWREIRSVLL